MARSCYRERMSELLGLHTKREMSTFVPDRTWQRWVERDALVAPSAINGFRHKARIFFEASLVPVMLGARRITDDDRALLRSVAQETRRFLDGREFARFAEVLREHIDQLSDTDLGSVGRLVGCVAPTIVDDLNAVVARHEQTLRQWSVEFQAVRAVLVQVGEDVVWVRTLEGGKDLRVARSRFAGSRDLGAEVLVKHVSARGAQDTFVLPMTRAPTFTDDWKNEQKRALDAAAAIAASDDGAVARRFAFLYRLQPDTIASFQRDAENVLGSVSSEQEWDAFLTDARLSDPIVLAGAPSAENRREPEGIVKSANADLDDDWQRRLLDTPSPLAGLPSRRR